MVAQLQAPISRLVPLVAPSTPPVEARVTYGYRRGRDRSWELTGDGLDAAAVAQRIVLSYALGFEDRGDLAERYALSETQIQSVIRGVAHHWFTDPIRRRLIANGIGKFRMNRSARRAVEVRQALERLGGLAADMLRNPGHWTDTEREQVATDLYLISGVWREAAS